MVDLRLIDLAIILDRELDRVKLKDVLAMMRDMQAWKTYVVVCEAGKVLGGCVLKEHLPQSEDENQNTFVEISLIAIDGPSQLYNLGSALIKTLKSEYAHLVTHADNKAARFFAKMGFKYVPLRSERRDILPCELQ